MMVLAKFTDRKGFTKVMDVPWPPQLIWRFYIRPRVTFANLPTEPSANVTVEQAVFELRNGDPRVGLEYEER